MYRLHFPLGILAATLLAVTATAAQADVRTSGASLKLSDMLAGALNTSSIFVASTSNVTFNENPDTGSMSLDGFRLTSVSAESSGAVKSLQFDGGVKLIATFLLPSGRKNPASTGGWMEISGLKIDYVNGSVSGSVQGDHGVGSISDLTLWKFDASAGLPQGIYDGRMPFNQNQTSGCGSSGVIGTCEYTISLMGLLPSDTGPLRITEQAFQVMSTSLALTSGLGVPAMQGVSDYGSFSVQAVPEPASWAFMAIGIAGLSLLRRATSSNQA